MWHSLQVSSNNDLVAAVKAASVGGRVTVRRGGAGRAGAAAEAGAAVTDLGAATVGVCSHDLMFTARIKAVDATAIAHA